MGEGVTYSLAVLVDLGAGLAGSGHDVDLKEEISSCCE